MKARLLLTTTSSEKDAQALAHALVERQLAACVSFIPTVHSVYRWEGEIQSTAETLLLIKTTEALLSDIQILFEQLHPYEVPEFLALDPAEMSAGYLSWLESQCAK
ncbi:MAG: divalent-cation tolerance protein CutA [Bdellovibrionales bacterium]|nr:divalent-cation tolerance protein CutA [Bdellovibrionales bacterium]